MELTTQDCDEIREKAWTNPGAARRSCESHGLAPSKRPTGRPLTYHTLTFCTHLHSAAAIASCEAWGTCLSSERMPLVTMLLLGTGTYWRLPFSLLSWLLESWSGIVQLHRNSFSDNPVIRQWVNSIAFTPLQQVPSRLIHPQSQLSVAPLLPRTMPRFPSGAAGITRPKAASRFVSVGSPPNKIARIKQQWIQWCPERIRPRGF
ncbi:uncharacterized protein CCOS01_16185 [Colletotrichum costaricense]|uniref:Uncharacterized protein n=1 Tax=Colletotrichum costaricense TaxID=1209916 RepID=A0AAI9YG21_9PEZI|nr:uncharacterized protein CCOS01_16185 [Colletotrichum costaricense]KAK1507879.1 hypothetical protein CCOS01_16185 [Colletotrichum costaricense]